MIFITVSCYVLDDCIIQILYTFSFVKMRMHEPCFKTSYMITYILLIFITACHSKCSVSGTLGRCTGSNSSQCCLVYTDGVCNTTCGENEHLKDNFTCTRIQPIANTTTNIENSLPSTPSKICRIILTIIICFLKMTLWRS